MMKLTFSSSYNSIRELPITDLPAFTLITGLNGSGKSHLLQAISIGRIAVDIAPNFQADIRLFTWNDMVPQDSGAYSGGQLAQEREQLFQQYVGLRSQVEEQIRQPARAAGISGKTLNDLNALFELNDEILLSYTGDVKKAAELKQQITNGFSSASSHILQNFQNNMPFREEIQTISNAAKKPIAALVEDDFKPTKSPSWGKSQPFQQHFSKLFCQYAELVKANALKLHYKQEALDENQFRSKYMMPPWDFVNDTLHDAGLDFLINQPDKTELLPVSRTLS